MLSEIDSRIDLMQRYRTMVTKLDTLANEDEFTEALNLLRESRESGKINFELLSTDEKDLESNLTSRAILLGHTQWILKSYKMKECFEGTQSYFRFTLPSLQLEALKILTKTFMSYFSNQGYPIETVRSVSSHHLDDYHIDVKVYHKMIGQMNQRKTKEVTEGDWAT